MWVQHSPGGMLLTTSGSASTPANLVVCTLRKKWWCSVVSPGRLYLPSPLTSPIYSTSKWTLRNVVAMLGDRLWRWPSIATKFRGGSRIVKKGRGWIEKIKKSVNQWFSQLIYLLRIRPMYTNINSDIVYAIVSEIVHVRMSNTGYQHPCYVWNPE